MQEPQAFQLETGAILGLELSIVMRSEVATQRVNASIAAVNGLIGQAQISVQYPWEPRRSRTGCKLWKMCATVLIQSNAHNECTPRALHTLTRPSRAW